MINNKKIPKYFKLSLETAYKLKEIAEIEKRKETGVLEFYIDKIAKEYGIEYPPKNKK